MSLLLVGQIGPSATEVLALVSGMPAKQRLSRELLVLQAYIDESYHEAVFVMAGYVATIEQWMAFSEMSGQASSGWGRHTSGSFSSCTWPR